MPLDAINIKIKEIGLPTHYMSKDSKMSNDNILTRMTFAAQPNLRIFDLGILSSVCTYFHQ